MGHRGQAAHPSSPVPRPNIRKLGVGNIEASRQPMLARLRKEMPGLGFEPITPSDCRSASPRFLCGESYGTTRAAQIVSMGNDLVFDGVLLLSMTGRPEGTDLPLVMLFPTFAAGQWEVHPRPGRRAARASDRGRLPNRPHAVRGRREPGEVHRGRAQIRHRFGASSFFGSAGAVKSGSGSPKM